MEGTERAQPVHSSCLNKIVDLSCRVIWTWKGSIEPSLFHLFIIMIDYQSCRVIWTWKGLSKPSLFTLLVFRIVYLSCRVIWTWKGLSEPGLFTLLVLTGLFNSFVGCFGHGRD